MFAYHKLNIVTCQFFPTGVDESTNQQKPQQTFKTRNSKLTCKKLKLQKKSERTNILFLRKKEKGSKLRSIAVIKHQGQKQLREELVYSCSQFSGYTLSLREVGAGVQSKNLEAEIEEIETQGTRRAAYWLA